MKVVFFDGYCSLCNSLVDWLMRMDKRQVLKFASLQGETASRLLHERPSTIDINTIIYLRDEKTFERSTAVLHILADLGGALRMAKIFLYIPQSLRDLVYRVVAANRYRLFGKRDTCRMPTAAERDRLLP